MQLCGTTGLACDSPFVCSSTTATGLCVDLENDVSPSSLSLTSLFRFHGSYLTSSVHAVWPLRSNRERLSIRKYLPKWTLRSTHRSRSVLSDHSVKPNDSLEPNYSLEPKSSKSESSNRRSRYARNHQQPRRCARESSRPRESRCEGIDDCYDFSGIDHHLESFDDRGYRYSNRRYRRRREVDRWRSRSVGTGGVFVRCDWVRRRNVILVRSWKDFDDSEGVGNDVCAFAVLSMGFNFDLCSFSRLLENKGNDFRNLLASFHFFRLQSVLNTTTNVWTAHEVLTVKNDRLLSQNWDSWNGQSRRELAGLDGIWGLQEREELVPAIRQCESHELAEERLLLFYRAVVGGRGRTREYCGRLMEYTEMIRRC